MDFFSIFNLIKTKKSFLALLGFFFWKSLANFLLWREGGFPTRVLGKMIFR